MGALGSGSVDNLVNSCDGEKACRKMGFNGNVDDLQGSCNGPSACEDMARYGSGSVGNLGNSCNYFNACYRMAYEGIVGDVKNSCNGVGEEFPLVLSAPSSFLSTNHNFVFLRKLRKGGLQ